MQVKRFVDLPYRLYEDCSRWVTPLYIDASLSLNRKKHPFFEHSEADFFLAVRDGEVMGRICAANNKLFNGYHKTKKAHFYGFESVNNLDVARALFDAVTGWAQERGLDTVIGPKGLSPFDGYGILVKGFEKEVDFVSCFLPVDSFKRPGRVERIAKCVLERGDLRVKKFKSKRELVQWALRIVYDYNKAFIHNWEYYPFAAGDVKYAVDNVFMIADRRLIELILYRDDIVGFLFAFPDVSVALQRARGRLLPFGIVDILLEMKRSKTISGNGLGNLPEFQGKGGNVLLYYGMGKTVLA